MAISRATYCTREDVLRVLQVLQSPRAYPDVDRAIESGTRSVDNRCHRTFHPYVATKKFLWPDRNSSALAWRLWLDQDDVLSLTSLISGGVAITDYFLEPQRSGPPYTHLEIDLAGQGTFSAADTNQRAITAIGTWGYGSDTQAAGALSGAVASTSATTLTVTDGSLVGIGDLLLIDSERVIVTDRALVTTAQTLQTPMTALTSNTSVVVSTGTAFHPGEVITLGSEQMLIQFITANTLTVERAVNATVLAAHTGSTIYVPRTLTVVRGANGSTAATHLDATAVSRSLVPSPVRSLAVAESLVELQQGAAGYARTAGSGENERVIGPGPGLGDLRREVDLGFARRARTRAV